VTPGWLEALGRCLDSVERIATATPWTNNGEIASIPAFCRANPVPGDADAVGRFLSHRSQAEYPEIPTAVGFCMAISRTAIDALGLFDEETFGRGYGEENDFSMRARSAGFRNVLCDDAYVVHHGAASFGPTGLAPGDESMQRLLSRHPGYLEIVSRFIEEDPLAPLRDDLVRAMRSEGIALG
jgi:GT2 family glycosyltransferase